MNVVIVDAVWLTSMGDSGEDSLRLRGVFFWDDCWDYRGVLVSQILRDIDAMECLVTQGDRFFVVGGYECLFLMMICMRDGHRRGDKCWI